MSNTTIKTCPGHDIRGTCFYPLVSGAYAPSSNGPYGPYNANMYIVCEYPQRGGVPVYSRRELFTFTRTGGQATGSS